MRIRILDRILVAVAGIILIAACAGLVAQVFFQVDVVGYAAGMLAKSSTLAKVIFGVLAALLLVLGVYCLMLLFRHRGRKEKYILQKTESGELEISLKAMENMVQKCLDQHPELKSEKLYLANQRDGLMVRIQGVVASGISIPLTVDTLQKQIKQYVTACSGVEVRNVQVHIVSSGEELEGAPFAVEAPAPTLLLKEGETETEEAVPDIPADVVIPEEKTDDEEAPENENTDEPSVSPIHSIVDSGMPDIPDADEDDDRPIHQRIFSTKAEPCIVPVPPEMEEDAEQDRTEETAEDVKAEEEEAEAEKTADEEAEKTGE